MLILTRRVGETLCIGDDIKVTILSYKGTQVKIGIDAPKHVSVHRAEIYMRIQEDGQDIKSFAEERETTPQPTSNENNAPYQPKRPVITRKQK